MPWRLLIANLLGHKVRSVLTVLSLTVAIFAVCFLRTIVVSLDAGVKAAATNRLIVQSAVSLFVYLPQSYGPKIKQVKGVEKAMIMNWFGGYYQDPRNFFAQFAVEPEKLLDVYPELTIKQGTKDAFLRKRTGCLVGEDLLKKFGWKVGQKVPITGTIFPRNDGKAWEFEIVATYTTTAANVDRNTMYFHYKYLEEALEAGATPGPKGAGIFVLKLDKKADVVKVASEIDQIYENGPQRVQSTTEAEFQRNFVSMLGNVPALMNSLGGAIVFAILFAVMNTMLMASRQRVKDFGVLKALGFRDSVAFQLMMFESLLLSCLGGFIGIAVAVLSVPAMQAMLASLLPTYVLTNETLGIAAGISVGIGVISGIIPAYRAQKLLTVDALRATV